MEEQFILRVTPDLAQRLENVLKDEASAGKDGNMELDFEENGRTGWFTIGGERFQASLLDLPCVVESFKTHDKNVLIKSADIGQMILVQSEGEERPTETEFRHGITPPMRDARRRRFRREPEVNPELVEKVELELQNILAGGSAMNVELVEQEAEDEEDAAADAELAAALVVAGGEGPSGAADGGVLPDVDEDMTSDSDEDDDD